MKKRFVIVPLIAIVAILVSVGIVSAAGAHTPAANAPSAIKIIKMTDNLKFVPAKLKIAVGTTVVWKNVGKNVPHTTTSVTGLWDSGNLNPGQVFTFTFTSPGIYKYMCTYHGSLGMKGTIIVH